MTDNEIKAEINSSLKVAVSKANEFLKRIKPMFDATLSINFDYDFSDDYYGNAIGVYENGSVFGGNISIGCNIELTCQICKEDINSYPFLDPHTIIDEAVQTTVYHEMGHAILNYLEDEIEYAEEMDTAYNGNEKLFDWIYDNEEDIVEEFAWELYGNQPENSKLWGLIEACFKHYNYIQENKQNRNMKKQAIKLNESTLRKIVKESVKSILEEGKKS